MNIGTVLRRYRTHREITLKEFSDELGISSAALGRIERGGPVDQQTMMSLLNWLFTETVTVEQRVVQVDHALKFDPPLAEADLPTPTQLGL